MKQYSEGKLRTYTTFKVHFWFENYLSLENFEVYVGEIRTMMICFDYIVVLIVHKHIVVKEIFLDVIGNFEHRRCLTKLRISAHHLHIETGRYQGIPPHQRLCEQCDSGEVEDEIHVKHLLCSKLPITDR
jgi:hypothetical protein